VSEILDRALAEAIRTLAVPGGRVGHRVIQPDDGKVLLETEAKTVTSPVPDKRRASGAARIVGRALLKELGVPEQAIPKRASGAPLWPDGVTGSFAHDHLVAVAAVAWTRDIAALGIDVEPATPLPADMLDLVTLPNERIGIDGDPLRGRVLFAVKEAVYKAVQPLDGIFLDYHDIEVDLAGGKARTKNGRVLDVGFCVATHVVAVAWIAASAR
jgi:4'-phosphopantetheinyl transferase EntD